MAQKVLKNAKMACHRLGQYRMPFAWAARYEKLFLFFFLKHIVLKPSHHEVTKGTPHSTTTAAPLKSVIKTCVKIIKWI